MQRRLFGRFLLLVWVVMTALWSAATLASAGECPEDGKLCPDTNEVVHRNPDKNCEFQECPKKPDTSSLRDILKKFKSAQSGHTQRDI